MIAEGSSSHCAFCGLPVNTYWQQHNQPVISDERYCCYGCRFAASVAGADGEKGQSTWALTRLGLAIFFSMNVMVFTMVLWSQDVFDPIQDASSFDSYFFDLFRYLCLLFTIPVLFLLGLPLFENACECLQHGQPSIDFLLLLGIAAAYLYSVYSTIQGAGHVYYEVACMVLILVTLGRWLEANARVKGIEAIESLQHLLPKEVRVVSESGIAFRPLVDIGVGEQIQVLAGERIPIDGVVVGERVSIDEQLLTGESNSISKEPGDIVYGGTLNLESTCILESTATPSTGVLAKIIEALSQARQGKTRYERLADWIASWALAPILLIVIVTFLFHTLTSNMEVGILAGLAVTLIACPCALGIATPLAVWAALGQAANRQILLREGEILERLANLRAIYFDKTGTLTTGTPKILTMATVPDLDSDEIITRTYLLAQSSNHPLAQALAEHLRDMSAVQRNLRPISSANHPGRGVSAQWPEENDETLLGSSIWFEEKQFQLPEDLNQVIAEAQNDGNPLVCIGWGNRLHGVFVFQEDLRSECIPALKQLKELGLAVAVLTGDHQKRGEVLARELGISVTAGMLPQEKLEKIQFAKKEVGALGFVGDGINDAPALAGSDVGLAMGCGADLTRDAAEVCLLGNDLLRIPWLIRLSRQTVRIIQQNLFWAFAYNVIGIGLACSGWLNPILAATAMMVSSLMVVANSLRLTRMPD